MLAYATLSSLGYTFYLAQRLRPVLPRGALVPFGAMAAMGVVQVLPPSCSTQWQPTGL
jgi:hypothetical protein